MTYHTGPLEEKQSNSWLHGMQKDLFKVMEWHLKQIRRDHPPLHIPMH